MLTLELWWPLMLLPAPLLSGWLLTPSKLSEPALAIPFLQMAASLSRMPGSGSGRLTRALLWMLWTSLLVNVGMFLERFIIIVPALMRKGPMTFDYATYRPSPFAVTPLATPAARFGPPSVAIHDDRHMESRVIHGQVTTHCASLG